MIEFLNSVLASIVAGIILLVGAGIVSEKAKWVLIGLLSRIVDADLEYVYKTKKECEADLYKDLKETRNLFMIVPRGNELQREPFMPIFFEKTNSAKRSVKILMPRTRKLGEEQSWNYGDSLLNTVNYIKYI